MKRYISVYLYLILQLSACYRIHIPVGIILEPNDDITETVVKLFFSRESSTDRSIPFVINLITERAPRDNAVMLDRAVCRLLKSGIYALITSATPFSYPVLRSYSQEFRIPLVSPSLPEYSLDLTPTYGVGIRPSTTRAVLDVIRHYEWNDLVYLYDNDDGPEKLQTIFQLGYSLLKIRLLGLKKVTNAEEANSYLRTLEAVKKHRTFHVILDIEPHLAKDVIIRHVHDVHVGKNNFHFLLSQPVLEDFWISEAPEFKFVNVTGFQAVSANTAQEYQREWESLSPDTWKISSAKKLNVSSYYFHDAALVLKEGVKKLMRRPWQYPQSSGERIGKEASRDCLQNPAIPLTDGEILAKYIKQNVVKNGLSGQIQFQDSGSRKGFAIEVVEARPNGHRLLGTWSDLYGLNISSNLEEGLPLPLPRIDPQKRYKITTILSPPFMMLKPVENEKPLSGNDRFEGFCKDLIDLLARDLKFDYELHLVEDNRYGLFNENEGEWSGMIGEIIKGKANMAVGDLTITGMRHRVVDFVDPFATVSLSLLMKHPYYARSGSPTCTIFNVFSLHVWICLLVSALVVSVLLFIISKFTGSPDDIESASGIWGKKFTIVGSVWFTLGSGMMQGTGVFPRSISSRVLGTGWWVFTLIILSLYVANFTAQLYSRNVENKESPHLNKLTSLSIDSIIKESLINGWPQIGVYNGGSTEKFIGQSSLPLLRDFYKYLQDHPEVKVSTLEEAFQRVRESNGGYAFVMDSLISDYISKQQPCDTVTVQDTVGYAAYGIAVPLSSPLKFDLNEALNKIKYRGELAHLYRQWWIEDTVCGHQPLKSQGTQAISLPTLAGIFYLLITGLAFAALVGIIQYFRKLQKKEGRRQKLSFDDVALGHSLPLPPPEMLVDPPIEEDSGVIDGWAERKLVPTSFSTEEPSRSNQ